MQYPDFRNELFDKLYSFLAVTLAKAVPSTLILHLFIIMFMKKSILMKRCYSVLKTHMLYYVKTDRIFKSMEIEVDGFKFHFDVSELEHKI